MELWFVALVVFGESDLLDGEGLVGYQFEVAMSVGLVELVKLERNIHLAFLLV